MTLNQKIRALQFINLFLAVLGIVLIALSSAWWMLLVSYVIFILMCPLGISAGLHRLVTHKSFKTNKIIERILLLFSVYATVGSSIAWVAMHRMHHAFSDNDKDPHTPYDNNKLTIKNILHTWLGIGDAGTMQLPISFVKDIVRDPYHKFIHDNYFKILLIPVAILFLISPIWAMVLYSIPATMALHTTSIVNVLGHSHGYRNYNTKDRSTNSWIANLVSLGEGWHNNHHSKPANSSNSERWWEWDLIGQFIKLIQRPN